MCRQKRHGYPATPLPWQAISRPARNGLHSTKRVLVSRFALHRRIARVTARPARFAQRSDEPSRNQTNTPPHRTRKAGMPSSVRTGRTGGTSRRTAPRHDNGGYTLRQEAKRKHKSALRAALRSGCSVSYRASGRSYRSGTNLAKKNRSGKSPPGKEANPAGIKRTSRLRRPKKASGQSPHPIARFPQTRLIITRIKTIQ